MAFCTKISLSTKFLHEPYLLIKTSYEKQKQAKLSPKRGDSTIRLYQEVKFLLKTIQWHNY